MKVLKLAISFKIGLTNPGLTNPGFTNPGLTNPGLTNPGDSKNFLHKFVRFFL